MPKQKLDADGKPMVDDAGNPVMEEGGGFNIPEGYVLMPKDELDATRKRLDSFDKGNFGTQPPPTPSGPTYEEQVTEIDKQIEAIDAKIDKNIEDGKGISALNRERDKLTRQRNKLYTDEQVNRVSDRGIDVINQLSSQVMEGQMPHLNLVREDYDKALNSMSPELRMNPEAKKRAYELAVGQNIDKVLNADREALLRGGDEINVNDQTFIRKDSKTLPKPKERDPNLPTFEEHFGAEAMLALKNKGITPDQYAQRLGYADADAYIKTSIELDTEGGAAQ